MAAEKTLSRNEIIESKVLIGLDLKEIKPKLGYWWICTSGRINSSTGEGVYVFERAGHGRVEIHTQYKQDNKGWYTNEVVKVL